MWYKDSMKRKNENGIVDRETGWFTTLAASGNQDPLKKELHPGLMSVRITSRSGMMDNFNNAKNKGVVMKDLVENVASTLEADVTSYSHNVITFVQELVSQNPTLADDLRFYLTTEIQDKEVS